MGRSVAPRESKLVSAIPSFLRLLNVPMQRTVLSGQIVSDGGCSVPGDIAKAFGGGADFVMLGGMLAAHDECEGRITKKTVSVSCCSTA
ncbi:IMP dehydrogenase [Pantoea ananatis]